MNFLKNWTEKKSNLPMCLTKWPLDIWRGALGHLDISLVDDKYQQHGKISEILFLSKGFDYTNLTLCWEESLGTCSTTYIKWLWQYLFTAVARASALMTHHHSCMRKRPGGNRTSWFFFQHLFCTQCARCKAIFFAKLFAKYPFDMMILLRVRRILMKSKVLKAEGETLV